MNLCSFYDQKVVSVFQLLLVVIANCTIKYLLHKLSTFNIDIDSSLDNTVFILQKFGLTHTKMIMQR